MRELRRRAKRAGRSEAQLITEIVGEWLEDRMDYDDAVRVTGRLKNGREAIVDSETVWRGLADNEKDSEQCST